MARLEDDRRDNPYAAPASDFDPDVMDSDLYPEEQGAPLVYAEFWLRFWAALVDGILQQVIALVIGGMFGGFPNALDLALIRGHYPEHF